GGAGGVVLALHQVDDLQTVLVHQGVRVADVVNRGLQVATGQLHAERPVRGQLLLDAEDVLVLVQALQVGRREGQHADRGAQLAVGRHRTRRRCAAEAANPRHAGRGAVAVATRVGEVLAGEGRSRRTANGDVVRQ